jgi:small subunit ribosomal protein S6
MRKYETIFIINPELTEEDTKAVIEKASGIIQSHRGEVLKIDEWGNRKLAYEIKKMSKGYYVLLHFAGNSDVLSELERNFHLMDAVLKYQTVRLGPKEEKTAQRLAEERVSDGERTSEIEKKTEPPEEEKKEEDAAEEPLPSGSTSEEVSQDESPEEKTHREASDGDKEQEGHS